LYRVKVNVCAFGEPLDETEGLLSALDEPPAGVKARICGKLVSSFAELPASCRACPAVQGQLDYVQ